jgi:hypothetical protein
MIKEFLARRVPILVSLSAQLIPLSVDDEVVRQNSLQEISQPGIKLGERRGVSCRISPVPIEHVEINEIRENKTVVEFIPKLFDPHHTFAIRSSGIKLRYALVRKMSLIFSTLITGRL